MNKNELKSQTLDEAQLSKLTQLQELNLNQNLITKVPTDIVRLTTLTKLDLSENHLTSLPWEIGQLIV